MPKKIEIPFNKWSEERLNLFAKTATSRNKKYGEVGDTFEVNGTTYELDLVIKLPLWFVSEDLYDSEGALNFLEFEDIWKKIHPKKGFIPEQEVWYHHFRIVP